MKPLLYLILNLLLFFNCYNIIYGFDVVSWYVGDGQTSTYNFTIDKINWTPFNLDGEEDITVSPAEDNTTFKEYKYSVSGLKDFTTFQLKIGMTGSISSYPPIIRDMRAIALAV